MQCTPPASSLEESKITRSNQNSKCFPGVFYSLLIWTQDSVPSHVYDPETVLSPSFRLFSNVAAPIYYSTLQKCQIGAFPHAPSHLQAKNLPSILWMDPHQRADQFQLLPLSGAAPAPAELRSSAQVSSGHLLALAPREVTRGLDHNSLLLFSSQRRSEADEEQQPRPRAVSGLIRKHSVFYFQPCFKGWEYYTCSAQIWCPPTHIHTHTHKLLYFKRG